MTEYQTWEDWLKRIRLNIYIYIYILIGGFLGYTQQCSGLSPTLYSRITLGKAWGTLCGAEVWPRLGHMQNNGLTPLWHYGQDILFLRGRGSEATLSSIQQGPYLTLCSGAIAGSAETICKSKLLLLWVIFKARPCPLQGLRTGLLRDCI